MTEFVIRLDNRPGSLARIAELLAGRNINIEALAAWGFDGEGTVRLIVDDADSARDLFDEAGLDFAERRILSASLPNRPGELAKVARRLADAGVNVEAVYLLRSAPGAIDLAMAVDEPDVAETQLPVRGSATS